MADRKQRKDSGVKRGSYTKNLDNTGKVGRENAALKSFWVNHKMKDIIQLSTEELDKKIEEWIVIFEAKQIKSNKFWWYPEIVYEPVKKQRGPKKINHQFNTSFGRT